jgi:radical SAM superfamily enzyme YgiQ (UPF0313 family)
MKDKYFKKELGNKEFLGIQYLAAMLDSKGFDCDIVNAHYMQWDENAISRNVDVNSYKFIGISCVSQRCYPFTKKLVKFLRERGCTAHICLGGFYPSLAYEKILYDIEGIDSLILGEGEESIVSLVEKVFNGESMDQLSGIAYLNQGLLSLNPPNRIMNLDKLPFPVRNIEYLGNISSIGTDKVGKRFFRMLAGRGCYGKCSFCSIIRFYAPKYKIYRSPQNVVGEIEQLVNKYGINDFLFNDEIFYEISKKGQMWIQQFVELIKQKEIKISFAIEMRANDIRHEEISLLKSVGLKRVSLGVESGIQRVLDEMNKGCTIQQNRDAIDILKQSGITPLISFIAIIPTMSFKELKDNYKFLFSLNCFIEENVYNKLNIYSNCEYKNILEKWNLLIEGSSFYERHGYNFYDPKVELFSSIIEDVRVVFSVHKKKLVAIDSKADNSEILNEFQGEWIKFNEQLWMNIINVLIEAIDNIDINNIEEIELMKKIYFKFINAQSDFLHNYIDSFNKLKM